ncbi:MAG: GNAT family N-acetyltransferase [Candidatus Sericytochromatia bacterium]
MEKKFNFIIRKMFKSDLSKVADLYTLFWNDKMNLPKMINKFQILENDSKYIFLVAEAEGKIIGTIQGIICEELYGECNSFMVMENFVVDSNYRFKGVGKKLLSELEKLAISFSCTQIIFITENERKNTILFYEKLGFNSNSHKGFKKALKF